MSPLIRSETAPRTAINRRPCRVTFPTRQLGALRLVEEKMTGWRHKLKERRLGPMPGNGLPY